MHPVDGEVSLAGLGDPDELAPQAGPGGLRRVPHGVGDVAVRDDPIDQSLARHQVVDAPGAVHVVIRQVEHRQPRIGHRQSSLVPVALQHLVLDDPVDLPVESQRVLLETGEQVLPHVNGALDLRAETGAAGKTHRPIEVLPLDVESGELPTVGQTHLLLQRQVVRDVPDGPDGVLEGQVPEHHIPFHHLQKGDDGPDLHVGGVLAHVRVAGDHVEASEPLGVGVGLVPGVDDRSRPRRRRGDAFPDVLGPLRQRIDGAAGSLGQLPGAQEYLAGDEERDEHLDGAVEVLVAADEVVLVTAV